MRIFLGGSVKSAGGRAYLEVVATLLETAGHNVYLPHRDGAIPGRTGSEKGLLARDDLVSMGHAVFDHNLAEVRRSDALVMILDGLCWGTTVELGYAYAYKTWLKPQLTIVGVFTDPIETLDVMRFNACDEVVTQLERLEDTLSKYNSG